jgi:F-type H+-transporting ATPase subunit delta
MTKITVARKYSRALLEIGLKNGSQETLGQELQKINELIFAHKELRNVLFSSAYPTPIRKGIFQTLSRMLGLSPTIVDFAELLIDRGRINHLAEIAKSYEELCDEVANRIRATLYTALPLSTSLLEEIRAQLETATGKKILLSIEERPALIGGVAAQIGHVIYDGTLKTQLQRIKENLDKE